jgi:hypothetical protein
LEALRAEFNTLKAMCSLEVMKLCEELSDDKQLNRSVVIFEDYQYLLWHLR